MNANTGKGPAVNITTQNALEQAFAAGLRQFREKFAEAERVTPCEFAWRVFAEKAAPKAADPRFAAEAPGYAYLLLCQEHAQFNQYAK